MHISSHSVSLINDLISMRLSDMLMVGREDLSEIVILRRALDEVHHKHVSDHSLSLVSEMINVRLGDMLVAGREDLSEVVALRRALAEIHGLDPVQCGYLKTNQAISTRGRRRKVSTMIGEHV